MSFYVRRLTHSSINKAFIHYFLVRFCSFSHSRNDLKNESMNEFCLCHHDLFSIPSGRELVIAPRRRMLVPLWLIVEKLLTVWGARTERGQPECHIYNTKVSSLFSFLVVLFSYYNVTFIFNGDIMISSYCKELE